MTMNRFDHADQFFFFLCGYAIFSHHYRTFFQDHIPVCFTSNHHGKGICCPVIQVIMFFEFKIAEAIIVLFDISGTIMAFGR